MDDDIRKFEEIGTHPAANHNAIAEALAFHEGIGVERKAARLRYLRDRWMRRLASQPRVRLHTSLDPGDGRAAIGNVQVEGVDSAALAEHLWNTRRIIVVPIMHAEFEGLRVTPERLHHARRGRPLRRGDRAGDREGPAGLRRAARGRTPRSLPRAGADRRRRGGDPLRRLGGARATPATRSRPSATARRRSSASPRGASRRC